METIEAIQSRRAVKHYDADYVITPEEEQKLLNLSFQAPSSFNIQHWRVLKISDKGLREEIRKVGNDQAQMTDASLLYLLAVDVMAWKKEPSRYWKEAPEQVQGMLVPWIGAFYEGKEQLQRDEAMRSIGLYAQTLMLAATAMGYDSCPMIGFDIEAVGKLVNLPEDYAIGMLVAVGKGTKSAWPKPGFMPTHELVFENTF